MKIQSLSAFLSRRPSLLSLALLAVPITASAATIQSEAFNLYYDFSGSSVTGSWKPVAGPEGTDTILGDFSLTPTWEGVALSGYGVMYQNGVLVGVNPNLGSIGTARSSSFSLTVNGAFHGTPEDAASNPGYQISLVITQLSIYGVAVSTPEGQSADFYFSETTAGHTGDSAAQVLTSYPLNATSFVFVSNYSQLTWNPDDFESGGVTQQRSFGVSQDMAFGLQGVNIQGYVVVNYEAIPEPGTVAFVMLGSVGLAFCRFRRMRRG